ncbi:Gfo/Idh/MocA family oxidoreductase [Candidatus Bathyarchaeota archaeon]|nr:Gfo/Idh/MocA family oxidoreductase [Candidatus Bathyarchaeota archaeon]MBS7617480.1 Gfo/Idh/MocA family oxidoreductase [Candidatus Bathyarchaeota archaeon]
MKKLKVAVVGTGWVSGEHMSAYKANQYTELVAVCGRTKESAERKLKEYGYSAKIYIDLEEMLEKEDIDILSICTPNNLHPEETIIAAEHKKHVLIEKPVALNEEDLNRMIEAVDRNKVKTLVSFVLHWNPLLMTIDKLLQDDAIGEIYYGEVDYFHGIGPWYKQYKWNIKRDVGGSSLLSAGCHAVDALLWFIGRKPVEVFSFTTRSSNPDFKEYEYDPTNVTLIKFDNGSVGKVASSLDCKTPYIFNIELFGSKGTIRNNQVFSHKFPGQTNYATIPTILPDSGDVRHHPFEGEINHFVDCILNDKKPFPDLKDAVVTHRVIFASDLSAKEGKPIRVT